MEAWRIESRALDEFKRAEAAEAAAVQEAEEDEDQDRPRSRGPTMTRWKNTR